MVTKGLRIIMAMMLIVVILFQLVSADTKDNIPKPTKPQFEEADADGNGCVTWGEVTTAHPEMAGKEGLFKDVDSDGNSCVSWEEVENFSGWA